MFVSSIAIDDAKVRLSASGVKRRQRLHCCTFTADATVAPIKCEAIAVLSELFTILQLCGFT